MRKIFCGIIVVCLLSMPVASFGFSIIKNISAKVTGNFSLSPTNLEFQLDDGSIVKKELRIYNGTGVASEFVVEFEDVFADENAVPASVSKISKYISVDNKKFILDQGEQATIVVSAAVPENNFDKFVGGAVLVSRRAIPGDSGTAEIVTRLGALVFVDIGKAVVKSGHLSEFRYSGDGVFNIKFKNTGYSKLNPYGFIEFEDFMGRSTGKVDIDPWFVMPSTERGTNIGWEMPSGLSPWYNALLVLYPGYGGPENTVNESIRIYNLYTISIYTLLLAFIIIIFVKFFKHGKK